jgi:hypothetical protein
MDKTFVVCAILGVIASFVIGTFTVEQKHEDTIKELRQYHHQYQVAKDSAGRNVIALGVQIKYKDVNLYYLDDQILKSWMDTIQNR